MTGSRIMQRISVLLVASFCLANLANSLAATKPHTILFGKWIQVKVPDADGEKMRDLKVRPILIDSRLKEYSTGNPHDVSERLLVVRRVFRLNDALPQEAGNRWQWQPGGWLFLDRVTGRISQLNLPDFDPFYSEASWYRDYVAYCGVSDDGKKLYAMVVQIGRRKPILNKELGPLTEGETIDSQCAAPVWERTPTRVTFHPAHLPQLLFSIRGRAADLITEPDAEQEN